MKVNNVNVVKGVQGGWVMTQLIEGVPYDFVLQQLARHRSFSFSVQSTRAGRVPLDANPEWQAKGRGKMFSQTEPSDTQSFLANLVWNYIAKPAAILSGWLLDKIGLHRQHSQIPLKPYATVSLFMTGDNFAWKHFWDLRLEDSAQSDIQHLAYLAKRSYKKGEAEPDDTKVYGPYLPDDGIRVRKNLGSIKAMPIEIVHAIARVARVSTNAHYKELSDDAARAFVKRLYDMHHASPFEHFYRPLLDSEKKVANLRGFESIRAILGLDIF